MSSSRLGRFVIATAVPLALLATPTFAAPAASPPALSSATADARSEAGSRIGIALIPDTQFYSRYDTPDTGMQLTTRYGSNPFAVQAQWISDNAEALNIPMAIHLGDVVDQAVVAQEWNSAWESLQPLFDQDMSFSILAGNHDIPGARGFDPGEDVGSDAVRDLDNQPYLEFLAQEEFDARDTLAGRSDNGFGEYHVFEAEGQEFLQIALSWYASPGLLNWAKEVMAEHPTMPVILSTHQNITIADDGVTAAPTTYSEYLWDELINDSDQIFLVVSGHHHGSARDVRTNAAGNDVLHVVSDHQMAYQGGNGIMNLLELDLTDNSIDLATFSPWVAQKPTETLNVFDQAIYDAPHQEWSVPFDFSERFRGFNPYFGAGTGQQPDLTEKAKALAAAGFTAPQIDAGQRAEDAQDYPVIEGTIAHWRPGQSGFTPDQAVPVGAELTDSTGTSPMTRQSLDTPGVVGAQEGDVVFSTDRHPLSSDAGSLEFRNSDRENNRMSLFATATDAPANTVGFTEGYTFEAFVKIDEDWTTDNAWMGAVTRGGQVGESASPPVSLAFSNLREFQWATRPLDGDSVGSAWSHEMPRGQWLHVAVVNDPVERTVTMYVDGAPILRNQVDQLGLAFEEGSPWIIGAKTWDSALVDGWLGSIGEVRLVDHPLTSDQWLTARAGDQGTTAGDIPVRAEIPGAGQGGEPPVPGALVLSIDEGAAELANPRNVGSHLRLTGVLPTVSVTDSRPEAAGWSVTGQSSDLTSNGATVRADRLGWAPFIEAGHAAPGAVRATAQSGGAGLAVPATLGSAAGQARTGTAQLSADVVLEAPVDTRAGAFSGGVTISLFPQD